MGKVEGKAGHNQKPSRQVADRHGFKFVMQDNLAVFSGFTLGSQLVFDFRSRPYLVSQ